MKLFPLVGRQGAGKTTFSIHLARHFRDQGLKVATIQRAKSFFDVGRFLQESPDHYLVPNIAGESLDNLAVWLPAGYDIGIFEAAYTINEGDTSIHERTASIYRALFSQDQINELIPYQETDHRLDKSAQVVRTKVINPDPSALCVDINRNFQHIERLKFIEIEGRLKYPVSLSKRVIAFGIYPPEFRQIFPNLMWYPYDTRAFIERYKQQDSYDLALIGYYKTTENLIELRTIPRSSPVFCFYPPIFFDDLKKLDWKTDFEKYPEAWYNNPWKCSQQCAYTDLPFIATHGSNLTTVHSLCPPQCLIEAGALVV